jgi:hypothetical protein
MQENTQAPRAISDAEWAELALVQAVRDAYGFEPSEGGAELARATYGAHFDFISGTPGYVGDAYVLLGDNLGGPLVVIRDWEKRLKLAGVDEYLELGASSQEHRN